MISTEPLGFDTPVDLSGRKAFPALAIVPPSLQSASSGESSADGPAARAERFVQDVFFLVCPEWFSIQYGKVVCTHVAAGLWSIQWCDGTVSEIHLGESLFAAGLMIPVVVNGIGVRWPEMIGENSSEAPTEWLLNRSHR